MRTLISSTLYAGLLCAVTSVAANAQTPRSQEAAANNTQRIADLVVAYKILLNEGVLDSFGHVSVRSATDPDRFFMPYALPPSLVGVDDVIEYSTSDSQPIDPRGRRVNGERYIHGEIYKARPDVQAVIHSHSQAVIPFSVAGVPLRPVVVQAGFLPLETPNFEIRDARGNERGMQITTTARGAALAKTLGKAPVALMRGHGNVIVGSSVKQAAVYAVYTDINARMQLASLALNSKIVSMNEPELFDPSEFDISRPWENFRQKILSAGERAKIDRGQFGLEQTQKPR
jgi:ribulose-5-phosphate 4-epimerase/fuculose-1-phosphate aldolase